MAMAEDEEGDEGRCEGEGKEEGSSVVEISMIVVRTVLERAVAVRYLA